MALNYVFIGLLVATCLYAWWKGGAPERIGAAIFATGCFLTTVLANAPPLRWRSVEWGVLLVDAVGFAAFFALSLRANRFWTLWVTGLLGVGVIGHLAKLLGAGVLPWAYAVVLSIWSYPILALIAIGAWQHQRRIRHYGIDESWSRFSPRPGPTRPNATRAR